MKTTKRKEFIKWLIDKGLEINTQHRTIDCNYEGMCAFSISDMNRYNLTLTGIFNKLPDVDITELYIKIVNYAYLDIDERFKEYETETIPFNLKLKISHDDYVKNKKLSKVDKS